MKVKDVIKEEINDFILNEIENELGEMVNESLINESTYKVYHGTNVKFNTFDPNKTADGTIWFTDNIDSIKNGGHGGDGNKYIMTRYITINNPAGWDEYEKYSIGELENMGYDGVILPQDDYNNFIVFSTKSISSRPNGLGESFDTEVEYNGNQDYSSPLIPNFGDRLNLKEEDYRGEHSAPDKRDSPMYDLIDSYPDDIYSSEGARYYGDGVPYDNYSISVIKSAKNRPEKQVVIYRAVPKILTNQEKIIDYGDQLKYMRKYGKIPRNITNFRDKNEYYEYVSNEIEKLSTMPEEQIDKIKINSGDWVTINPIYAREHGRNHLGNKFKILKKTVLAKNLYTDGNSIHEWGYNI